MTESIRTCASPLPALFSCRGPLCENFYHVSEIESRSYWAMISFP